jgi:hypothetical protein
MGPVAYHRLPFTGWRCSGSGKLTTRMPRKLRVQYPGAIYHVMNRGDRREAIFLEDRDREFFLETLGEACKKTDWQVRAWCLIARMLDLPAFCYGSSPRACLTGRRVRRTSSRMS